VRRYILSFAMVAGFMGQGRSAAPLKLEKTIPLTGVTGRIDHMTIDLQGQRLFVAALGNNSVEVLDVKSGKVINSIKGLKGPQGILYVPEAKRLFVANRDDGSTRAYDGGTLKLLFTIGNPSDADNLRYDLTSKTLLLGHGAGALSFYNLDGKLLGSVRLEGHSESFQLEPRGARVFVNTPQNRSIAIVDRRTKSLVRTWPLSAGSANYAMATDEKNNLLFVVCRKPAKLLVLEANSGIQVDERATVGDVDDLFYDAARKRLYLTGGEGFIDVIYQKVPGFFEPLANIPTAPGARTSLYVPELSRLFVAVPARDKQNAEIRVYEAVN
jgi:YVTN family beta-propeller protein